MIFSQLYFFQLFLLYVLIISSISPCCFVIFLLHVHFSCFYKTFLYALLNVFVASTDCTVDIDPISVMSEGGYTNE